MRCYRSTCSLRHVQPSTPSSLPCRSRRRPFFSSAAQTVIEPALRTTHSLIEGLHDATHLPWIACVPLTAIIIRAVILTPLTIYTRQIQRRRAALRPLILAWAHHLRRSAPRTSPTGVHKDVEKAFAAKRRELYQRWHCARWRLFLPFAQLPLFLVVIETLRRMCGVPGGLLGMMTQRGNHDVSVDASRDEVLASLDKIPEDVFLEPSLAHEGALWFPNLLAPDPWLLLPFMLSGTLFAYLHLNARARVNTVQQWEEQQHSRRFVWAERSVRALKFGALLLGPVTLQVPSAILIYWITSSAVGICQSIVMDRIMPMEPRGMKIRNRPRPAKVGK